MKVIITGATGVAGLAIYRAALNDPLISNVTLLLRRAMPSWAELPENADSKTQTIIHDNFLEYSSELMSKISDHDACIWALGKSAAGMSEKEYTVMTHGYTMEALKAFAQAGVGSEEKPFRFVFISGEQADPTEKSAMMWARVKGRTEKDVLNTCRETTFMRGHVIRPAYFFPQLPGDRSNQRSLTGRALDVMFSPLLSHVTPSFVSPLEELGAFPLEVAKGRWPDEEVFSNKRMRQLMKGT